MMTCRVCLRPDREQIDRELVLGTTLRTISAQLGTNPPAPSPSALARHRAHIPAKLARAADAREVIEGGRLLRRLESLTDRAERMLTDAEKKKAFGPAAALIREVRECAKLLGTISGEIKGEGHAVTINIIGSAEWQQLQAKILDALTPYADARLAVARALLPAASNEDPDA